MKHSPDWCMVCGSRNSISEFPVPYDSPYESKFKCEVCRAVWLYRKYPGEPQVKKLLSMKHHDLDLIKKENRRLRILIAAIIRGHGGRLYVFNRSLQSISFDDSFTTEEDPVNDRILLTYQPRKKP